MMKFRFQWRGRWSNAGRLFLLVLLLVLLPAPASLPASGVLPGDWVNTKTRHFSFFYHPKTSDYVKPVINSSDEELERLSRFLGMESVDPIEVRIARTTKEMKEIKPGRPPQKWAAGIAMCCERIILMSMIPPGGGDLGGLRELFLHEVAHILTHDASGRKDLPIWFNEGIAIHLSGEFSFARHKTLLGAALRNELLPVSSLDRHYPEHGRDITIAYAQSADLVKFISREYGGNIVPELFKNLRRGDAFQPALEALCARSLKQIEAQWLDSLNVQYRWIPSLTGGGALWGIITILLVLAYYRRLRKAKETLRKMDLEEKFFSMGQKEVIFDEKEPEKTPRKTDDLKRVYHEGGFHTLH